MLTTSDEKLAERLLQEDDTSFESLEDINHAVGQRRSGSVHKHTFAVILSLSMSVNLLLSSILLRQAWISQQATNGPVERTIYAGLARDVPMEFMDDTPYASSNETLADELWDALSIDPGVIALPDSYAEKVNLPQAQRFPWDHSQGIYLLNSYHNLHCLKVIRRSLVEYHRGSAPSWRFEHVRHCLDGLLEDVICNADDTPRWTSNTKNPQTGEGQQRMCRDWNALETWAKEHNACWRFVNETSLTIKNIDRYKYCPEGSKYEVALQDYLEEERSLGSKASKPI